MPSIYYHYFLKKFENIEYAIFDFYFKVFEYNKAYLN